MEPKKILVACGSGGVTSKNIAMKIERYLAAKRMPCKATTCRISEIRSTVELIKPDLAASASELPELPVPTVRATAILTGVGADKVLDQIYQTLLDREQA